MIRLLFLGDLVYGEVVSAPTDEEFATQILSLNRGAVKCLESLGLLENVSGKQKSITEERKAVVLQLYELLKEELGVDREAMLDVRS